MDVEHMVALGATWHPHSHHADHAFDAMKAAKFALSAIASRHDCALVAEHEGHIVGLLIGTIQDWPFLNVKVATDLVMLCERAGGGRMLLRAFEQWAWAHGADEMLLGVSFGGDPHACEPIYKRAGYSHIGGMFSKRRPA